MGRPSSDELRGGGGNDILNGNGGDDILKGEAGNDTMTGGAGNDRFVLANTGIDTITDYSNVIGNADTIDITLILSVTTGTDVVTDGYFRVTTTGLVQVDLDGGGNSWVTLSNVNTGVGPYAITFLSGGVATTVNVTAVAPPIGIDLDGDGVVSFLGTDIGVTFDYGAGLVATAWVAGNDGILARDANGDGQVTHDEIVFATSGSDLEGLRILDTNDDGQLSAADDGFLDFEVWQDIDSDGHVDAGEMQSLTALGIASISLTSDGVGYAAARGDVQVVGTGSYTRTDGSTGVLADAVFATGTALHQEQQRTATAANGNVALFGAIAAVGLAAAQSLAAAPVTHPIAPGDGIVPAASVGLSPVTAQVVAKLELAEMMAYASTAPASDRVHDAVGSSETLSGCWRNLGDGSAGATHRAPGRHQSCGA